MGMVRETGWMSYLDATCAGVEHACLYFANVKGQPVGLLEIVE